MSDTVAGAQVQRKCDSCGRWNEGIHRICPQCGRHTDLRVKEAEDKEAAKVAAKVERQRVYDESTPIKKFWIRFVRIGEAIYIGFISFMAWLMAILGG